MKKLFALGLLLAAMFGWSAQTALAWWPCYPLCGCDKKGSSCCASITIKQYNAFTPICCGSMHCNGCCPMDLTGGGSVCGPGMMGCAAAGAACYDPCGAAAICSGCGQLPAVSPAPIAVPGYQAPAPTPMEGARPMSYNPYMVYSAVQPAAYRPMYTPAYQMMQAAPNYQMMPVAPNPVQYSTPYYWNGR